MGELGDKLEGNVKDAGGQLTGDKKTEFEGKAQKLKGDVEGAGREMGDKAEEASQDDRPSV